MKQQPLETISLRIGDITVSLQQFLYVYWQGSLLPSSSAVLQYDIGKCWFTNRRQYYTEIVPMA